MGDRYGESETLTNLGVLYRKQGKYEQALAYQQEALTNCRELGRLEGQAVSLQEMGHTLRALERYDEARACWREALTIFERLNSVRVEDVRTLLAGAG
jgi:tetratricopeptide (TPR) repeat protein